MQRDHQRYFGRTKPSSTKPQLRWSNVRKKAGGFIGDDNYLKNSDSLLSMLDTIVSNGNYSAEFLKKIYIVEFYRIFHRIADKIKNNGN